MALEVRLGLQLQEAGLQSRARSALRSRQPARSQDGDWPQLGALWQEAARVPQQLCQLPQHCLRRFHRPSAPSLPCVSPLLLWGLSGLSPLLPS